MTKRKRNTITGIKDRLCWIRLSGDNSDDSKREVEELERELKLLINQNPNTGPNHDYFG